MFWKFYMNFVYSVDEKPAEGLVTVLNELLAASLSHGDKVTLYELFLQYSATICTDLQDLLRLKADYAVWKLAARAEQEAKEEERGSVKREAPAPAPVMAPVQQGEVASYPAIPGTVPGTMPAMQTMPMMPAQVLLPVLSVLRVSTGCGASCYTMSCLLEERCVRSYQ